MSTSNSSEPLQEISEEISQMTLTDYLRCPEKVPIVMEDDLESPIPDAYKVYIPIPDTWKHYFGWQEEDKDTSYIVVDDDEWFGEDKVQKLALIENVVKPNYHRALELLPGCKSLKEAVLKASESLVAERFPESSSRSLGSSGQSCSTPPDEETLTISVAAGTGNGESAAAAFARNYNREYEGCSTEVFKGSDPLIAEAVAFRHGVQLASEIQTNKCILEGNAVGVIIAITDPNLQADQRIAPIQADIRRMSKSFSSINFRYVKRSENAVARSLAHYALSNHVSGTWLHSPPTWFCGLVSDMQKKKLNMGKPNA